MTEKTMFCSFCGKPQDEVPALVAGPEANICVDCVHVCIDTLIKAGQWPSHSPEALHRGLMALASYIGPNCVSAVNAAVAGPAAGKECK